jgi:hypothetical protein
MNVDLCCLAAELRRPRLERNGWRCEQEGADGLGLWVNVGRGMSLIHSIAREEDGRVWAHVSVAHFDKTRLPSWEQTRDAWWTIYPDRRGIIVVAAEREHYTHTGVEVMHVFGCLEDDADGLIPNFARGGTL